MKLLAPILLLLTLHSQAAKNYYVSSSGGNNGYTSTQAQSQATPWASSSKINAFAASLQPGDSVLFKRGDVFTGVLIINASGVSGNPINIGAYGTGAKPVLTTLNTVLAWTSLGGGIYESSVAISSLPTAKVVTLDGKLTGMGRYPNSGWLTISAHSGNTTVTSSTALPANYNGGQAVVRTTRWVQDRFNITAQSGNTVTITPDGTATGYPVTTGWGFFIQNNANTLDQYGEWYYDPTTKKLRMYFGGFDPTLHVVKVGNQENGVTLNSQSYINVSDVEIQGGNTMAVSLNSSNHIGFDSVVVHYALDGFRNYYSSVSYLSITNSEISDCLDHGAILGNLSGAGTASFLSLTNSSVTNIGTIHGAGSSGDAGMCGVWFSGSNNTVQYNKIDTIGYDAVRFDEGINNLVDRNEIHHFTFVKDDGGGIYTYEGPDNTTRSNNRITNNIISDGVGYGAGSITPSTSESYGVYLDQNSNHILVQGNVIANTTWYNGYFNNAHDINYRENFHIGTPRQMQIQHINTSDPAVNNLILRSNVFYVDKPYTSGNNFAMIWKNTTSKAALLGMFNSPSDVDSNVYRTDTLKIANTIQYSSSYTTEDFTLNQWLGNANPYGWDVHARRVDYNFTDTTNTKFVYNATKNTVAPIEFNDGTYVDVYGNAVMTLAPYTGGMYKRTSTTPALTDYNIINFGASVDSADNSVAITNAINAANGALVTVPAGVFMTKLVTVNTGVPINIGGTGTLKANPSIGIGEHILQLEHSSSVTVKNITLDGNKANTLGSPAAGIVLLKVWDCDNILIDSVKFQNNNYLATSFVTDTTLEVMHSSFINTDAGVCTQGGNILGKVHHNYFQGGTSEGVSIYGDLYRTPSVYIIDRYIEIYNNQAFDKDSSSAYHVRMGEYINIHNNYAKNCVNGVGSEQYRTQHLTITYNTFDSCSVGVKGNMSYSRIENNIINDPEGTGIWLGQDSAVIFDTVRYNYIRNPNQGDNGDDGIRLERASNSLVDANTIIDNRTPLKTTGGVRLGYNSDNNTVSNNTIQGKITIINNGTNNTLLNNSAGLYIEYLIRVAATICFSIN